MGALNVLIAVSIAYVIFLFGVAFLAERARKPFLTMAELRERLPKGVTPSRRAPRGSGSTPAARSRAMDSSSSCEVTA